MNARLAVGPASPTAGPSSPTAFHTPRPPATPPPLHPVAAALAAGAGSGGAGSLPLTGNALMAKKAVGGSRAIAKAGGMDSDSDFGLGAMASRMKSYTAGKAIAISHQPLQANRHVHLPHVAEDRAVLGGGGGAGGSGGRVGELSAAHPAVSAGGCASSGSGGWDLVRGMGEGLHAAPVACVWPLRALGTVKTRTGGRSGEMSNQRPWHDTRTVMHAYSPLSSDLSAGPTRAVFADAAGAALWRRRRGRRRPAPPPPPPGCPQP